MKTEIFALREHSKEGTKEYIAIRSDDDLLYINIPRAKVEEALHEFETGEELNVRY